MRGRRTALAGLVLVAVEGAAAAGASLTGNAATGRSRWPGVLDVLREHPWGFFGVFTVVTVVAAVVFVSGEGGLSTGAGDPPPPAAPRVPEWVVDREETDRVVAAVCRRNPRAVGITATAALHGAGGFGKTTLADVVWADRRVQRRFRGRIYRITLGRDIRSRAAIAAKIGEATRFITGDTTPFDDPDVAGAHLGRLLDERPAILLILDDVWWPGQLEPFLTGGSRSVRLVTTRVPEILPARAERVVVDEMSVVQATTLLTHGLPPWPRETTEALLRATGHWPLLLRLTNQLIARQIATGADPSVTVARVLERLRLSGPTALDPDAPVDLNDPKQRNTAVRAGIETATELLPPGGPDRFAELAVFTEDENVPIELIARLWQATGSLSMEESRSLCGALAGLSLLSLNLSAGGRIRLHDVIRDYLHVRLGQRRLRELHATLVDTVAATMPSAPPPSSDSNGPDVAWWSLPDGYLADHLIGHLLAADRVTQAETLALDLRWITWRLELRGRLAPWGDLTAIATPIAQRAARDLARAVHLLAPTDPSHALASIVRSRLGAYSRWSEQAAARHSQHPALRNRWPLPDLPHPSLRRALTGHTDWVTTVAIAVSPDGAWLVTGSVDGTARIWDAATNTTTLTGHSGRVTTVAIAPDGVWLATGSEDQTVRIWDVATSTTMAVLGHSGRVTAVAISPDGTWLATGSDDATVRIWSSMTSTAMAVLGHSGRVTAVAISPDGVWLAAGSEDQTVRIWDVATSTTMAVLGHSGRVTAVAISPDGVWLAAGSEDQTVRIWDVATSTTMAVLGHSGRVTAVAISPDGTWLATGSDDATVRIWDVATSTTTRTLTGHTSRITALSIAPDGTWLATTSNDHTARMWDLAATADAPFVDNPSGRSGAVKGVAVSSDGTWIATIGHDGAVRVWDPVTAAITAVPGNASPMNAVAISAGGDCLGIGSDNGTVRIWNPTAAITTATHTSRTSRITALAVSPDGTWLAIGSDDSTLRIWNPGSATDRSLMHFGRVTAVTISPDSTWLATGSDDGTVRIWDRGATAVTATLTGHTSPITIVAISPDSELIATGSMDGTVQIRYATTTGVIATLTGHTSRITTVAISPDSKFIATASNYGTIRIWRLADGSRVTMMRTDAPLNSCAWLPDGTALAVGGDKGLYLYTFVDDSAVPGI